MESRISIIQNWIKDYIIKLDLCPFAQTVQSNDSIYFEQVSSLNEDLELESFVVNFLNQEKHKEGTAFLIFEENISYLAFLDFYYMLEDLVSENEKYQHLKVVCFHPEYEHGNVLNEVLHFSNRSPYPLLQLLNLEYIDSHSNSTLVKKILNKNEITLEAIGASKLEEKLNEFRTKN